MKLFNKRTFFALLALLVATAALHRLGHAQSAASSASTPSNYSPADPSVEGRWANNAKALAVALGDEGVPAQYSIHDLDWQDTQRQRLVPVRLYLPDQASAQSKVPLVVFSHGLGGSRLGYTYLGRYFAQNGIASLHVQHVGSDRAIWMGNFLMLSSRLKSATTEQEAIARAQDLRFALSSLLANPHLGSQIDSRRVMAAGHSFGANTTLLVAGARVTVEGQALALRDDRIKAALVLSSPPFYNAAEASQALGNMPVPSLHITATEDVIRVPGYFSSAQDRVDVYHAYQGAPKGLVVFKDGSHSMFTDRLNTGGEQLNPQVKRATRELALAFAQSVFRGQVQTEYPAWAQQHAGILAQVAATPGAAITATGGLVAKP